MSDLCIRRVNAAVAGEILAHRDDIWEMEDRLFSRVPLQTLGEDTLRDMNHEPGALAAYVVQRCRGASLCPS